MFMSDELESENELRMESRFIDLLNFKTKFAFAKW